MPTSLETLSVSENSGRSYIFCSVARSVRARVSSTRKAPLCDWLSTARTEKRLTDGNRTWPSETGASAYHAANTSTTAARSPSARDLNTTPSRHTQGKRESAHTYPVQHKHQLLPLAFPPPHLLDQPTPTPLWIARGRNGGASAPWFSEWARTMCRAWMPGWTRAARARTRPAWMPSSHLGPCTVGVATRAYQTSESWRGAVGWTCRAQFLLFCISKFEIGELEHARVFPQL